MGKTTHGNCRYTREELRILGICTRCRKNNSREGKSNCSECASYSNKKSKQYREQRLTSGCCGNCGRKRDDNKRSLCAFCRDKYNALMRRANPFVNRKLVDEVFEGYGGAVCSCCGETEKAFLQLDHVNDDGATHRKVVGMGSKMYRWAKRNNYPPTLQILCSNCNWGKEKCGVCPHQTKGK